MVCGEEKQVKQLFEWLKRGPKMARVLDVETKALEYMTFDNFSIR
ncbi:MAG: acylphosphatase [Gammaproteobacteria bacterium]|nr:acylphosphatase [Gammaproteobacteria bacterium]